MTTTGVPLSPSLRGTMAVYFAHADFRCPGATVNGVEVHGKAMESGTACPICHLALGDYVRALDVVVWP